MGPRSGGPGARSLLDNIAAQLEHVREQREATDEKVFGMLESQRDIMREQQELLSSLAESNLGLFDLATDLIEEQQAEEPPRPEPYGGSTHAEDPTLSEWMCRLWSGKSAPMRIELWAVLDVARNQLGELIYRVDFRPGERLDAEDANRLANEMLALCQDDCDVTRRESLYRAVVTDENRGASRLVRHIGPFAPRRFYRPASLISRTLAWLGGELLDLSRRVER